MEANRNAGKSGLELRVDRLERCIAEVIWKDFKQYAWSEETTQWALEWLATHADEYH